MTEVLFRFLKVIMTFELITLAYSLFMAITTDKIFMKNDKNKNLSYIPIYNIIVLLDIVKLNRIMAILYFLPVTNVIVFILIFYRLSIMYNLSKSFTILLILFPIVMLPILNYVKMNTLEVENEYDDVSGEMVTLLTESEMNELNEEEAETVKVDNTFKRDVEPIVEDVPVFKASNNEYIKNNQIYDSKLNDYHEDKVERVEITEIEDNKEVNTNKFISNKVAEKEEEEDKDIEYLNF